MRNAPIRFHWWTAPERGYLIPNQSWAWLAMGHIYGSQNVAVLNGLRPFKRKKHETPRNGVWGSKFWDTACRWEDSQKKSLPWCLKPPFMISYSCWLHPPKYKDGTYNHILLEGHPDIQTYILHHFAKFHLQEKCDSTLFAPKISPWYLHYIPIIYIPITSHSWWVSHWASMEKSRHLLGESPAALHVGVQGQVRRFRNRWTWDFPEKRRHIY